MEHGKHTAESKTDWQVGPGPGLRERAAAAGRPRPHQPEVHTAGPPEQDGRGA